VKGLVVNQEKPKKKISKHIRFAGEEEENLSDDCWSTLLSFSYFKEILSTKVVKLFL